jgi:hypothetical protein
MQNPYEPARDFNSSTRDARWNISECLAFVVLILLASHGAFKILEDAGVIVRYGDGSHFWFEEDLRKWIQDLRDRR